MGIEHINIHQIYQYSIIWVLIFTLSLWHIVILMPNCIIHLLGTKKSAPGLATGCKKTSNHHAKKDQDHLEKKKKQLDPKYVHTCVYLGVHIYIYIYIHITDKHVTSLCIIDIQYNIHNHWKSYIRLWNYGDGAINLEVFQMSWC